MSMKQIGSTLSGGINGLALVLYFILFPEGWTLNTGVVIATSIIISIPLSIIVHEMGHVIVGRLQGMKLLNMCVGPFVIERHDGKLYFHFVRSSLGYIGRAMMYFPKRLDKEVMRDKLIPYIYGGAITNIILGAASYGIAFGVLHSPFFLIFGAINILIGAMNLTPATVKVMMTDGMVIQKLRMTPVEDSVFINSYVAVIESVEKKDTKEWDPTLIVELERLIIEQTEEPSAKGLLQMVSYYYLPDNPERVEKIGREVAFLGKKEMPDVWQDFADISFATALFFSDKLMEHPDITYNLENISTIDKVTDLKRSAFLTYIQGDKENAIEIIGEACEFLVKWNPLYLRGGPEKRLLNDMINKIQSE